MDDITAANTTNAQPSDGTNWNATSARAPAEAGTTRVELHYGHDCFSCAMFASYGSSHGPT